MKKQHLIFFLIFASIVLSFKPSIAQLSGKQRIDSLFSILKTQKEDTAYALTLNELANSYRKNDPDTAIYFANKAMVLAKKLNFKSGIANSYYNIGLANNTLAKEEEAFKNLLISLKLFTELGQVGGIAKSYLNIGNVYLSQANYPNALKNYFSSLVFSEKINNKKGMASAYLNIAIIYKKMENYPEAIKNYEAALKFGKEINDNRLVYSSFDGLATIEITKFQYDKALKYQLIALNIVKLTGDKSGISKMLNNIGLNYYNQGKYPEALENYFNSLKIKMEIGDKSGSASTYGNIGNVYTKQRKYKEANEYLNKGLVIAKEYNILTEFRNIYAHMAELDSLQGNYGDAFNHFILYIEYRDSLLNEQNTKKTVQLQMQYEFDKKESTTRAENDKKEAIARAEIKRQTLMRNSAFGGIGIIGIFSFFLVQSVNRRRKTIFEKQISEVEMTALRSQMNPHFIFNSLHSINNYMMNNDKRNASDYLGKFSKLMRLILENSREQEVPLEKDLLTLELYMELEAMRFENKFSYKIEVADDLDPENLLVPPMILQPFVENSILHGLQHKESDGRILIKIQKENDMLVCVVEDNGVGRQKAMEMKETTATHKGESLGMKITNARIDIINKLKKAKASVNLTDLSEGMRAEVKLPFELAF